ncbi:CDP-alcohol phosphatidyltransferase family protein [Hahella ganghwensis]|uniref:CDP-alcohol phosphatidyltransferase family protein n=1 Tax=Hahella ganghwensis TaxID=286420 RepID=UPI00037CBC31|nr:CDP-alcohol phosphatidyltransferase family protein [Hahella ganghwensis]
MHIPWRQLPNAITLLRILLVVPIVYCLAREWYRDALWLFLIAGVSDGLDGFLARTFHWSSRFGAITDPLADKALLVSVFVVLTLNGLLPWWLMVLVFVRDLIIVIGALAYHMMLGSYSIRPSIWGKLSTFTQITYVLVVVFYYAGLPMPALAVELGVWAVAAVCLVSGSHYVTSWGRKYCLERSRTTT